MVLEGETFVDAGEAAAWCEEKCVKFSMIPRLSTKFSGTLVLSRHLAFLLNRHELRSLLNYGDYNELDYE